MPIRGINPAVSMFIEQGLLSLHSLFSIPLKHSLGGDEAFMFEMFVIFVQFTLSFCCVISL